MAVATREARIDAPWVLSVNYSQTQMPAVRKHDYIT